MVTKTAFSSNAGSTTGAVSVFSGQMDGLARLVRSQPFRELNVFMNQLGLGDFQHLIDNFDLDGFNRLAVKLYALKTNTHPLYVRLLNYLNFCLTTMLVVEVNVGKELGVLRQEITKLRAENSILHNVTLLREYLETLTKRTFTIFKEQRVTTSKIKLRPEYELYIQRYGFPKNGAFDAQLLAEIINELKARLQPISCAVPSGATVSGATVSGATVTSGATVSGATVPSGSAATGSGSASECVPCSNNA
jgi:hypothetical protein